MTATQRPTRAGYGSGAPAPARAPRPAPDTRRAPALRLVRPGEVTPQVQLRRRRLVLAGVVVSVCAALFGVVGEHAILAQQQFRLANMQAQAAADAARNQALQLQVAQLQSPGRIVSEARTKLGMVPPAGITYLVPGHPAATKVKGQPAVTPTTVAASTATSSSSGNSNTTATTTP